MAWREVQVGPTRWIVAPVAERVAHAAAWRLVLSCRAASDSRQSVYASTGLQSSSRTDLYAQADRLSDARVVAALAASISEK